MRCYSLFTAAVIALSACQSPTKSVSQAGPPQSNMQVDCPSNHAAELVRHDERIAVLKSKMARGYQTSQQVIKVANPLKLCKGIVPFVSVCVPTPKPQSALPTYEDYKEMKAELAVLEKSRAKLAACRA